MLKTKPKLHGVVRLTCPCCGGEYRNFLPAGAVVKRPNAICPGCGSRERHRVLWLYFLGKTNLLRERLRVLHFAPSPVLEEMLAGRPNLEYITADICDPRATLRMDITDILFKSGSIDVVLCVHVLEHVPDDRKAMTEMFRVLKPGGWAIIQSPVRCQLSDTLEDPRIVSPQDRQKLYGQSDHVRAYGPDYKDRLEEAGFAVRIDSFARDLGSEMIQRYSLGRELDVWHCTKPAAEGQGPIHGPGVSSTAN